MLKKTCLSLLLSFSVSPSWALTQHPATSKTTKVILYQGQAMMTRELVFKPAKAGDYQITLTDLPLNLNTDSVRVSGQGSAGLTIHNIEITPLPQTEIEDPELHTLNGRMLQLARQMRSLENQGELNELSQGFLDTVGSISEEKIKKQLAYYQIDIKRWQELLAFLRENQGKILENGVDVEFRQQALAKELESLQNKIAKVQELGRAKTQQATIYVTANQIATYPLQISYLIPGATWSPTYDARLDEQAEKLSLTYFGDISQNTGENWNEVKLSLSTATPVINAEVPALAPWYIVDAPPESDGRQAAEQAPQSGNTAGTFSGEDEALANRDSDFAESEVEAQGISVLFSITHPVNIQSTQHTRRVAVATRSFNYKPEYHIVPKLSDYAYLKVKLQNTSSLPLLPGNIRNYVGLDYTGTSQLPLVRPQEEIGLNFGVERNIKVRQRQVKSEVSFQGVMKETKRIVLADETEITNFQNEPRELIVLDHMPASNNTKIQVRLMQIEPKPSEELKNNLLKWKLSIKPWEKKIIRMEYQIEHPTQMEVYTNFQAPSKGRKRLQNQYEKLF